MFKIFAPAEFKHSYIETSCWPFTSFYVTQMQELIQLFKNRNNYYGNDKMENKNKALEYFSEQSWGCKKLLSTYAENEETAWTQILGSEDIDTEDLDATVRWLRSEVRDKRYELGEWIFPDRHVLVDKRNPAKVKKLESIKEALVNLDTSLTVFEILKKYMKKYKQGRFAHM